MPKIKCDFCPMPAVMSYFVRRGLVPIDPKVMNTQADLSRLEVVHICQNHASQVPGR
jgi:hypothetical protein